MFCWLDGEISEDCGHIRCQLGRCHLCNGELIEGGLCEECDALPAGITMGQLLEALLRAGCAPKRWVPPKRG